MCWDSVYTGLPKGILVDQGTSFGPLFVNIAALNNVEVWTSGIEAHSSLGLGERYHEPCSRMDLVSNALRASLS